MLMISCDGQERDKATGSGVDNGDRNSPQSEGDGANDDSAANGANGDGAGDGNEDGAGEGGGDDSEDNLIEQNEQNAAEDQIKGETARSLESCTEDDKAWIAVVDSGAKPSACGESLVNWCCTKEEAVARFPTMTALAGKIDKNLTAGFKLYHCSRKDDQNATLHFGKIENNSVSYKTIFITDVFETDTGNGKDNCQPVTTQELKVEKAGDDETEDEEEEI